MTFEELLDRDPLDLTEEDIGAIVKELRAQRTAWKIEESSTNRPRGAVKVKAEALGLAGKELTLKDLGL